MTNEKFTYLPGVSKMTPGVVVEPAVLVVMFENVVDTVVFDNIGDMAGFVK